MHGENATAIRVNAANKSILNFVITNCPLKQRRIPQVGHLHWEVT